MADHKIRKACQEGIGSAAVDLSDVRHVMAAAAPQRGRSLDEQANDALRAIQAAVDEEGVRGSIVQQTVFLADAALVEPCRRIVQDFYGDQLPATSYIAQPPCDGKLVAIEALGVGSGRDDVAIERVSPQIVVVRHHGIAWVHAAQAVSPEGPVGIYGATTNVLEGMRRLFSSVGVRFDQVVRRGFTSAGFSTWRAANSDTKNSTAPAAISTATPAFSPIASPHRPAGGGVRSIRRARASGPRALLVGTAIALDTGRREIRAAALENPRQTAAYDYTAAYSPQSPKFSLRHGPVLRRERNDLHLRDREHHRLPDAARRAILWPKPSRPWTTSPTCFARRIWPGTTWPGWGRRWRASAWPESTSSGAKTTRPFVRRAGSGWAICR